MFLPPSPETLSGFEISPCGERGDGEPDNICRFYYTAPTFTDRLEWQDDF